MHSVLRAIRPSFLILTPVCVFLGLSSALPGQSSIDYRAFLLVLLGALSAHISVNALNEYYDFKSGLDARTQRTPFSGGSGALPENPAAAEAVFRVGLISLVLTISIGVYLAFQHGARVLPPGVVGVLLVMSYTQWLNRSPFLCLIAPGTGFGLLMVVGTHVVLTGDYSRLSWLLALVPFFLVNNLLLLNQYPDMRADASVGRNTFPVAFGMTASNFVYALFMFAAYGLILIYLARGLVPKWAVIALLPMVLSGYSLYGAVRHGGRIGEAPRFLAANVAASVLTPLLLGLSMFTS